MLQDSETPVPRAAQPVVRLPVVRTREVLLEVGAVVILVVEEDVLVEVDVLVDVDVLVEVDVEVAAEAVVVSSS